VHPPLYYLIAKTAQIIFGTSLFVQKLVAIFSIILLMIFSIIEIGKLFGQKASLIFIMTLFAFPALLEYSVQVRMYSWALLFVTINGVVAFDLYSKPEKKKWITFMLTGLAAAYTHYFALL